MQYTHYATGWVSNARRFRRCLPSPNRPDRLWGPLSPLFNGYRGPFPGINGLGVMLTTHLHAEFTNKQSYYASIPPNALMGWT